MVPATCQLTAWVFSTIFPPPFPELTLEVIKLQVLLFLYGSCWGSFLAVVTSRHRHAESILWPASHCDTCHTPLRYWQLIPILSYLLVHGRCTQCTTTIPPETFLMEIGCGLLAMTVTDSSQVSAYLLVTLWLAAAGCDLATLTFPGWIGWGSLLLSGWHLTIPLQLLGLLGFWLIQQLYHHWPSLPLGNGDAELLWCYSLSHSLNASAAWLLTACTAALVTASRTPHQPIAFVPYLTGSALFWWLWSTLIAAP